MSLRAATQNDFDAIYAIYMDETVNPFMLHDPMDKDKFRDVFDDIMARDYAWVFEYAGQVVGMCSATIGGGRTSHVAMLLSLGIRKGIQNKGFGRKIVKEIIAQLKDKGISRFEVGVEADNKRGLAFYETLGFVEEGRFKNYVKRGGNHFVDVLLLATSVP